jgi:hypothetical protein
VFRGESVLSERARGRGLGGAAVAVAVVVWPGMVPAHGARLVWFPLVWFPTSWFLVRGLDRPRGSRVMKGIRWMPWHQEAMKDVARCEKPWGAASRR